MEHLDLNYRHWVAVGLIGLCFSVGALSRRIHSGAPVWTLGREVSHYERDVEPLLAEHCFDCHGEGSAKGDVALDHFGSAEERLKAIDFWAGVHHSIESGLMPPADKPGLADEEKARLVGWIERDVFRLDPRNPDPGHVVIRRLNRQEYRNTMRELFGDLSLDAAAGLPLDDAGYGFDNIGAVLSMSPDLLEKYVMAADRVLSSVIRIRPPDPDKITFEPEKDFRGVQHAGHGTGSLAQAGAVGVKLPVKRDGEYQIRILAGGDQAGDEPARMGVKVAGVLSENVDVKADASRPRPVEFRVELRRGEQWLEMAFLNDYYDPNHGDPRRRDRNLHVHGVELIGPLDLAPPPPSVIHQSIFAAGGDGTERQKAERVLAAFGRKAWRRSLKPDEVNRLAGLVELASGQGDSFEGGVRLALQATLIAPQFLFRGEGLEPSGLERGPVLVTELELASRLSFFLWSGPPDEPLLELAESGKLRANLEGEVVRMIRDRRAEALVDNFAGQWLQLRNLDLVTPDRKTFPKWDDRLRDAMRRETEEVFAMIFEGDRSLLEFLDSSYTFLNERLAQHYGISGVKGEQFRRVSLEGESRRKRGSVLTHGSILTITSNPTRTSPVNRGNWVLENVLGSPAPPPPVNVPLLEASAAKAVNGSLRARLEAHRQDVVCSSCHARMDPIGFAMENYDGIGAWRDSDAGERIDASGELAGVGRFQDMAGLRKLLLEERSDAFVRTLCSAMLSYSLGRGLEYYDKPALARIHERVVRGGLRSHELVLAIVESVPFQYRRPSPAGLQATR